MGNVPWNQTPGSVIPPPYIYIFSDTIERCANALGMSIPPPATTENGDRERSSRSQAYKALFLYEGV